MIKHNIHIVLVTLMVFLVYSCFANLNAQTSILTGKIVEQSSGNPILYANMALVSETDSSLILGGISDKNGKIEIEGIPVGRYTVKVSFIGFKSQELEKVIIDCNKYDIGILKLDFKTENVDEVTVQGHKNAISYSVDRKLIDAKSFPGADVAMDLLENIPSLQVDFDGNLSYRGDGNFKVFINGRQVSNGEEKLRQLSAEKIDVIEVITNPSAKFDAEGTAGIIQVILKRNRLEGFVLSTSAKTSTLGSYEWQFSIDQKGERGGWYLEGLLDERIQEKTDYYEQMKIFEGSEVFQTISDFISEKKTVNSYLELGFNYDFTDKDYIDFTLNVDPIRRSDKNKQWGEITESESINNEVLHEETYYYDSRSEMDFMYLGAILSYEHAFKKNREQLLSANLDYSTYLNPLKDLKVDSEIYSDRTEQVGYKGQEDNEMLFVAKVEYKDKLGKNASFEAGAQIDLDHIPKITNVNGSFDDSGNLTAFANEHQNQEVDFKQDVYAAYLTYKNNINLFEYRLGLRTEYTDRKSNYSYSENGGRVTVPAESNFIDFFPTFHGLFNFSKESQLSVSYTRRISRPHYWALIPLKQYETPYRYYQGNGSLMPSYANAYELGYKFSWNNNFLATEVFARNNKDVIQSYFSVNDFDNITLTKENVGDSWSVGAELMTGVDVCDWWNTNLSASLYRYILNIDLNDEDRVERQFSSDSRINNIFYLGNTITFKFDLLYKSPRLNVQQERDSYWYANAAIKKTFNDDKWQVLLAWSDIFSTIDYTINSKGDNFNLDVYIEKASFASLKITYTIDNQN